ncbi:MAG: type II toxin-antitoxin system HicB family antitoxin [Saprospiraceae bacterium]|nr:type II toxin-antitoxin system HicB family antitoxin [Saprospiraceae bacterium]
MVSQSDEILFTAHIKFDKASEMYYGYLPNLPAAQTFALNLDELYKNLNEVLNLCLEELSAEEISNAQSHFIGTALLRVKK